MFSSERNKPGGSSTLRSSFQRSISPSGRFCLSSSSVFASPMPTSSSPARPTSPERISLRGGCVSSSPSPSIRFSIDHRHTSVSSANNINRSGDYYSKTKKMCMCSPTTHPGSFRCSLHKNLNERSSNTVSYRSHRLYARRSAMTNSLVRIGTVDGDLVKRALAALIRPSSHQQRRRSDFRRRPSRLSVMSKADD